MAAVHGNETAGTQACRRIIDEIERGALALKNGKMTLVPVCNPEAYRRDVRNIDENLNRVMTVHDNPRSYEQKLANEICPLIREHRFTLDLHSTHCVGDVPFAFCDYPDVYNQKLIDALPVDLFWKAGRTFTAGRPKSAIFHRMVRPCVRQYGHDFGVRLSQGSAGGRTGLPGDRKRVVRLRDG